MAPVSDYLADVIAGWTLSWWSFVICSNQVCGTIRLWIGVDGFQVRRASTVSEYDKAVDIQAPVS